MRSLCSRSTGDARQQLSTRFLCSSAGALLVIAATLSAEDTVEPAASDEAIIVNWPERAGEDEFFDGSRFVSFTAADEPRDGPYAVSVWINAGDLSGGNPVYGRGIARSTNGDLIGDWILSVLPDGRLRFQNWRNDGVDADGAHITVNEHVFSELWFHIVAVWDGEASRIYVNGDNVPFENVATDAGWGSGHEIGRGWTTPEYHWVGEISSLRIDRRAPGKEEVAAAFSSDPRSTNPVATFDVVPTGDLEVSAAIDREIVARLEELGLEPSPAADDYEFLRRVTLDLAGRIPTTSEVEAFLADESPDKRHRRIDTLLSCREMPSYWAHRLSDWLMTDESRRDPEFVSYVRRCLQQNRPWDDVVREMLVAVPDAPDAQFASLFLSSREAALADHSIARDIGRTLFGVNLRCAQCHDHPDVPEWTRERFYGLSAFFSRSFVHRYSSGDQQRIALGERPVGELEYTAAGGDLTVALPMFLDGRTIDEPAFEEPSDDLEVSDSSPPPSPPFSRRSALADLALDPGSPYFKRALVNRVWHELMGRGLVEPIDMMHDENPPTHPAILDLLADDFADHGFDLKRLIGNIMHSDAYARTSRRTNDPTADETLYAAAVLRPMNADQLSLSLPLAAGHFDGRMPVRLTQGLTRVRPLPPSPELLAVFDAAGESFEPTAEQALFLLNGEQLQVRFGSGSPLVQRLTEMSDDTEAIRLVYLAALSRLPSDVESRTAGEYLRVRGEASRSEACQELVWALLTSTEFRFNH